MRLSRYIKVYPCTDNPGRSLLFSTKRASSILIPDTRLAAAREGNLSPDETETLTRLGFLVADPEAEREEMRNIFVNANPKRRLFNAIVVLNLDCNLACGYCYEDNFRGNFYMSSQTANLLVETVTREQIQKGRDVKLSFYGGEPLLSLPLIKEISSRLQAAAAQQGTKFQFSLVTNGTLFSHSVVRELLPLGLSGAKITLDGPRHTHDQSRPFISGSGSYDAILDNLAEICHLVPLQLGGNFTRQNYRQFPPLLDDLAARGVTPDKVATVLFVPVTEKSGANKTAEFNTNCICSYEPWLVEATLHLREETLRRGYPVPRVKMSPCMVELATDIVINYEGSLYKCPAFMAYDSLKIGSLEKGIGDYSASHNIDVWKNDRCLDCAYLPLCFGGCRQMTLLRTNGIEEVDCRKDFYDATLETVVRQDLASKLKGKY